MLIAAPGHTYRTPWRGRRSFAAYYRWVDDALHHRAHSYRLRNSALIGLPDVHRVARQRFRGSAFADVHAAPALDHDLTAVTRNVRGSKAAGVEVLNLLAASRKSADG